MAEEEEEELEREEAEDQVLIKKNKSNSDMAFSKIFIPKKTFIVFLRSV